jgi:hypothetical protein
VVGEADGVRVRVGLRVTVGVGTAVNEAVGSTAVASGVCEGGSRMAVGSGASAGLDRVEEIAQQINRIASRSNNVRRIGVIIAGVR